MFLKMLEDVCMSKMVSCSPLKVGSLLLLAPETCNWMSVDFLNTGYDPSMSPWKRISSK